MATTNRTPLRLIVHDSQNTTTLYSPDKPIILPYSQAKAASSVDGMQRNDEASTRETHILNMVSQFAFKIALQKNRVNTSK
jgi:hypothetical protein